MTLGLEDREILINYRIEQAKEIVSEVEHHIVNGFLKTAINRIYYGMFYSLLALALKYRFETSKHSQLIGWFNKNFIHTGIVEVKYGKLINEMFILRTKTDYEVYENPSLDQVNIYYQDMKLFISEIEKLLIPDNQ